MRAGKYNLVIEQGVTYDGDSISWQLQDDSVDPAVPIDLTGYSARMQIRASHADALLLAEYSTDPGEGITIDGPVGAISLAIDETESQAWTWRSGVYDLEIIEPDGGVIRLLEGTVTISPEVTR